LKAFDAPKLLLCFQKSGGGPAQRLISFSPTLHVSRYADDVPDTRQWWFGDGGCWRIRTYALDHDIHAYQIANSLQTTLELAKKNNRDNYGDIIQSQHLIHFVDCANPAELEAEFGRIGLVPWVEIVTRSSLSFCFSRCLLNKGTKLVLAMLPRRVIGAGSN
jgi:hypothetical protein